MKLGKARISRRNLIGTTVLAGLLVFVAVYAAAQHSSAKQTTITPQPSVPTGGHGKDTAVHAGPSTDATTPTPAPSAASPKPVSNPDHPVSSTLAKPTQTLNTHAIALTDSSTFMDSTCNSVIGATCHIQASRGAQVMSVSESKTIADSTSGGVELVWNANQLSGGSWSIQAVATKDGQKAVSDAQTLEVTQ